MWTGLLQVRNTMPGNLKLVAFASKSLSKTETYQSNIGREALGILYSLEKFHHCCFVRLEGVITDVKTLVAIFKNDIAIL